jgi:hypothetical protein
MKHLYLKTENIMQEIEDIQVPVLRHDIVIWKPR